MLAKPRQSSKAAKAEGEVVDRVEVEGQEVGHRVVRQAQCAAENRRAEMGDHNRDLRTRKKVLRAQDGVIRLEIILDNLRAISLICKT